jgi:hypothetical protein
MNRLVIIGGGSSIKGFDLAKLNHEFTFGLNFVCHYYDPTALIWIDRDFYSKHQQVINNLKCVKITRDSRDVPADVFKLLSAKEYHGLDGLSKGLYHPYLVGLFSLSLGIALKFKEIYLLGFDGRFVNDKSHFHDIVHRGTQDEMVYIRGNARFDVYKDCPSKIYNVSLDSAIHAFPKISYEQFCKIIDNNEIYTSQEAKKWLASNLRQQT